MDTKTPNSNLVIDEVVAQNSETDVLDVYPPTIEAKPGLIEGKITLSSESENLQVHMLNSVSQRPYSLMSVDTATHVYIADKKTPLLKKDAIKYRLSGNFYSIKKNPELGFLDHLHLRFKHAKQDIHQNLDLLFSALSDLRTSMDPSKWESFKKIIVEHPIGSFLFQDPCTKRSYQKPRGYAGDAELLDYFYGYHPAETKSFYASNSEILRFVVNRPAGQAVRERLQVIAQEIDRVLEDNPCARILSVACGHMRELKISTLMDRTERARFFAMDQDEHSLRTVSETYGEIVTTIKGSVKDVIKGRIKRTFNNFDLLYVAGLYDYLPTKVSLVFTKKLFEMLNPGGILLITNFTPTSEDIGYMETFMQWDLIYREIKDIDFISQAVPCHQIGDKHVFRGKNRNILYLRLTKTS